MTLVASTMTAQEPNVPARKPWNELDFSWISVQLGFAAMEDGAFYSQDAASKQQVGDLSAEQLFRVDDLSIAGDIKLPRPWRYTLAGNYRGLDPTTSRTWELTDVNLAIPLGDFATVTVGKQKEGVGLEMLENGRDVPFLERSVMTTATTYFESHIVGVRFSNAILGGRMTWSAGWFNNWLDDGLGFSESGQIFAGRVTGLALEEDGGRSVLHLGVSGGYQQAPGGALKSKSVPEVYEAPDFVDTGSFPADHAASFGAELAATKGPFSVSAEYTGSQIDSTPTSDPYLSGFYVMATWSLTGETRPYLKSSGIFGRIEPAAPFSFKHGGLGAWEVAARYSRIDLTSGTLDGGVFDRWSGALSWFPTRNFRFEFNYGYGRLQKSGLDGRTNFYQLRLQLEI